jgi:hypothetical protein
MATKLLTRFGYPKVPGDQPESIIDVNGPTAYQAFVPGDNTTTPVTHPSGGQRITAADFGLQSMDFVASMGSDDGRYYVIIIPELLVIPPGPPLPTQLPDGTFTAVHLIWIGVGAATQASGDLSASSVRLFARGH